MKKRIYLDNATTTWPKPEKVYQFMIDFYRTLDVSPGRSGYDNPNNENNIIEDLRKRLTKFFGGDEDTPERLVFTANATDSLNIIVQGILNPGDHVISTNLEHNAVLRPIYHTARDKNVEVTFIPFNEKGFVQPDTIRNAIKENTRLVIVNHGSNIIGTIQPISEIGRVCRDAGVTFAIDSSQTAGVVPINMKEMNIDIVAFTGHKSLMGASGIGGLCVRKHVNIGQSRFGGTGICSADMYHLEEYPWRLETGTPNMPGIASLWAAQDWIDENGGIEKIYAHEMNLAQKLRDGLRKIKGVTLYYCDSLEDHLAALMFNINDIESTKVGAILHQEFNVACRAGLHCAPLAHRQIGTEEIGGTVRFGIGPFNTEDDINAALDAVAQIASRNK